MDHFNGLLKQPSTWRGIILLLFGAMGLSISNSDVEILINAGFVLSGAIGALTKD